jgi:hypothetical protein
LEKDLGGKKRGGCRFKERVEFRKRKRETNFKGVDLTMGLGKVQDGEGSLTEGFSISSEPPSGAMSRFQWP